MTTTKAKGFGESTNELPSIQIDMECEGSNDFFEYTKSDSQKSEEINRRDMERQKKYAQSSDDFDFNEEDYFRNYAGVLKEYPNSIIASLFKAKAKIDSFWSFHQFESEDSYHALVDELKTYLDNHEDGSNRGGDLFRDGSIELKLLPNFGFGCLAISRIVEG